MVSILYGSLQAFTQTNARLILGYSSVAQLGFITLGIFALDAAGQGAQGALLQAVNHGLVVAPLFFVIALLAERAEGSEDIRDYGGIAFRAPVLAVLFLIVGAGDAGDAGLGELRGRVPDPARRRSTSVQAIAFVASLGVVLASVYALRMYIRSMHNRVGPRVTSFEHDASATGSCSCRWCWRSSRSRCIPQLALDAGEEAVKSTVQAVGSDDGSARQATVKGPEINWEALSPAIALTAGACIVLLVGLARSRVHPPQRRAGADDGDARRHRRARDLAVGRQRGDHRPRAGRSTT